MVATTRITVNTRGQGDVHDVSRDIANAVAESKAANGIATIFVVGSTAAMTTIEFEPGAVADLNRVFEQLAPRAGEYQHHRRWGDDNGSSHVRAAMLGPSIAVPFVDRELALGTWQQIVLVEFYTRARRREVIVQVLGE